MSQSSRHVNGVMHIPEYIWVQLKSKCIYFSPKILFPKVRGGHWGSLARHSLDHSLFHFKERWLGSLVQLHGCMHTRRRVAQDIVHTIHTPLLQIVDALDWNRPSSDLVLHVVYTQHKGSWVYLTACDIYMYTVHAHLMCLSNYVLPDTLIAVRVRFTPNAIYIWMCIKFGDWYLGSHS